MLAIRGGLASVAGLCLASSAPAQVALRPVGPPSAKLEHQFSSITGFRELPDGRVVVSDGIDQVVVVAHWATGRLDTLGRVGQGPGEYRAPDALVPLPNGATLLVDLGNARLSIFDASGKYRESVPIAQGHGGPGRPGGMSMILPRASDNQGRLYFQPMGGVGQIDSAPVLRWDRARNETDTVANVKIPDVVTQRSGGAATQSVRQRNNPFPIQDGWAVSSDGRIALVRAPIYRVDWVGPDRKLVLGKPVPVDPIPLTKADKLDWVGEQATNGLRVQVENRNGQVSMSFRRGSGAGGQDAEATDLDQYVWPAKKPPFVTPSPLVAPDGRLWVERSMPSGSGRSYDVFDGGGTLVARVGLPAGRRLVGVGRGVLYAKSVDDGGISQLERYPIP